MAAPQVRAVRKAGPSDLAFEPGFTPNETMEWLTTNRDALKVTGVMFREIGHINKSDIYGHTACSFKATGDAPEFKWAKHVQAAIRGPAAR